MSETARSNSKKICLTITFALFSITCLSRLQAQVTISKINQVELMKQFTGSWRCDISKDTTAFWDFKSYGTGLECDVRYITNGKIFKESKTLYGYDKKVDKFIASGMVKGMDMELFAIWFKSDNKYEIIYYKDILNPEKALVKSEGEFKSRDRIIVTKVINDKPVSALTYTRIIQ